MSGRSKADIALALKRAVERARDPDARNPFTPKERAGAVRAVAFLTGWFDIGLEEVGL